MSLPRVGKLPWNKPVTIVGPSLLNQRRIPPSDCCTKHSLIAWPQTFVVFVSLFFYYLLIAFHIISFPCVSSCFIPCYFIDVSFVYVIIFSSQFSAVHCISFRFFDFFSINIYIVILFSFLFISFHVNYISYLSFSFSFHVIVFFLICFSFII